MWSVSKDNIGSDHFPVTCVIQNKIQLQKCNYGVRWIYKKADWGKLQMLCDEQFKNLSVEGSVDDRCSKVVNGIYFAASQSIPLSSGISTRKNKNKKKVQERMYHGGQRSAR